MRNYNGENSVSEHVYDLLAVESAIWDTGADAAKKELLCML